MGFEYLDHPLAFKHVRDQVATMLKGSKKRKEKKVKNNCEIIQNCTTTNLKRFWCKRIVLIGLH